jgi:hypothetical protein
MINECGAIGFTKDPDVVKGTARMEAALEAIRQFMVENPEAFIVGPETEATTFVFGPRARIKVE